MSKDIIELLTNLCRLVGTVWRFSFMAYTNAEQNPAVRSARFLAGGSFLLVLYNVLYVEFLEPLSDLTRVFLGDYLHQVSLDATIFRAYFPAIVHQVLLVRWGRPLGQKH